MSKSQIERLGYRLISSDQPDAADLSALHELLRAYDETRAHAVTAVRESLDIPSTSRIKSTGTILEKLHRHGGSWLKSIHDIAGMRIVGSFDRTGQDALVDEIVTLFGTGNRQPKVIDRRKTPSYGYRAVHVIVWVNDLPIEIQVRTPLQHEWADLFERLADQIGRRIRYGEPPEPLRVPDGPPLTTAERTICDRSQYARAAVLKLVLIVADTIDRFEAAELTQGEDRRLAPLRDDLQARLQSLRSLLELLAEVTSSVHDALSARI